MRTLITLLLAISSFAVVAQSLPLKDLGLIPTLKPPQGPPPIKQAASAVVPAQAASTPVAVQPKKP